MIRAERIWRIQRVSGIIAMIALTLAMLALFDGLRGGLFGNQKGVQLVPGEEYAISGPMPPRTDRLEDFVVSGNMRDASISLVPDGIFTGYWFGSGMWRGRIVVGSNCLAGNYEFSVHDKFGEKQNPVLVFQTQVFASKLDRQMHAPSFIMRKSGLEPYVVAACLALFGILVGGVNYLSGRQWSALLGEHGCGEVFRLKTVNGHEEVGVELFQGKAISMGSKVRFTHPVRGDSCHGIVTACGKGEFTVQIASGAAVKPGDIACMMSDETMEAS